MTTTPSATGTLLGAAYAEADTAMLRQAFVETADYQALRHTSDFNYVVARRGAGKSAIFQRLNADFQDDSGIVLLAEQPQDYEMLELQQLLKSCSEDYRLLRPVARQLWTVHLLLEAGRAVSKNYRYGKSPHAQFISEYLAEHGAHSGQSGTSHCVSALRGVLKSNVPVTDIPRTLAATYQLGRITEVLRETLAITGQRVVALYDRLDEAWVPEVAPVAILGGLAKAAADCREKQFPIYPLLFIRDNMFRALAQLDDDFTRHIEGNALRLQWQEEALLHLVTARLRVGLGLRPDELENPIKVWNRFAHRSLHNREGFARCLRFTLYRPRDILVLLNEAYLTARREQRDSIIESDIEQSALRTSQHRLEDLCKEYDKVLPGIRLFTSAFKGLEARRPVSAVIGQLDEMALTNDYSDIASRDLILFQNGGEMFSALYSVGFIGVRDVTSGNFNFCHDGTMRGLGTLSPDLATLVHPCYWKALETSVAEEAREVVIQVNDDYNVLPTTPLVDLRLKRLGRLPEDLHEIPEGHDGSREFESWVLRAIRVLFSGTLQNIELKPNPSAALSQRDVVARNTAQSQLWRQILEDYGTRQLIVECKNYRELSPEDFRQVADYLTGPYGKFAMIVRRGGNDLLTENEKERVKAMFYEHDGKLVFIVPTSILSLCIRKLRSPHKYDYTEFTFAKHLDMFVRAILSMKHAPKYRQKRKKAP